MKYDYMKYDYLDAGLPQHAVEIEAALLSTYLANPTHAIEAHESIGFYLTKSDFYKPIHGVIYDAISKVYTEHDTVTPQLVKDDLSDRMTKKYNKLAMICELFLHKIIVKIITKWHVEAV